MQRCRFSEIFQENPDGSLSSKKSIKIGTVTLGPNAKFQPGVLVQGLDVHKYKYVDIAIEEKDGVSVIKGFYTS